MPRPWGTVTLKALPPPFSSSFAPRALEALKYLSAWIGMDDSTSGRVAAEEGGPKRLGFGKEGLWVLLTQSKKGGDGGGDIHTWRRLPGA